MNRSTIIVMLSAAGVVVALFLISSSAYVVEEGKQAVITQFGRPVHFATEAGLHWKTPFIQEVHLLEKRLLPWDGEPENMPTLDKKRIYVDVWARWRIVDPEKFFLAVRTEASGQKKLDDQVDSAVRNVVGAHNLIEVVRSTNDPLPVDSTEPDFDTLPVGEEDGSGAGSPVATPKKREHVFDEVTTGRSKMEGKILVEAGKNLRARFGMELVEVHIKRVNYAPSVKETVYQRMRSERLRIAQLFESQAEQEKNRIAGLTKKKLDEIEGATKQKTAEIRGDADAEVITLTATAYSKSPEFYEFLRRLEIYRTALSSGNTRLVMSTRADIFQLLKGPTELPPPTGAGIQPDASNPDPAGE